MAKLFLMWVAILSTGVLFGKSIQVNIDNPQFRKLVIAIPPLAISEQAKGNATALNLADKSSEELARLLNFSRLFNDVGSAAYEELVSMLHKEALAYQGGGKSLVKVTPQFLTRWKATGAEIMVVGRILVEKEGPVIEIQTIHLHRGEVALGKRYARISANDMGLVMRRYGDLILEHFTGRSGIFSSKITFIGRRGPGQQKQVFVCDFDGSNVVQVTSANAPHVSPHWRPDGKAITYTSFAKRNPDLYLFNFETKTTQVLSSYQGLNSGAQWAKNGKLIAYSGSKSGDTDIYTLKPSGGGRIPLITGSGLDVDPTFSPDGQLLAFVSGRFGNPHIFVGHLKWTGDDEVKVVRDTRLTYAGWYNSTPAWSPDSKKLVFAGYDKEINRYDIFMMNHDGKNLERLTLKTGDNESPSFSPNGQLVVFQSNRVGQSDQKGRPKLWVMARDGSGQRELPTGLYEAQTPSWSWQID